ncbi:MAG: GH3 auxin-responsive promoter family protein [Bacteroidota bacterium]
MKKRIHQIELFLKYPHEVQLDTFRKLIHEARDTEFGRKYEYATIDTVEKYRERVPLQSYEDIVPYVERLMRGEQNILWSSEIKWFSKSSGTTNARSKFIPVSYEALETSHFAGGKDLISIHVNNYEGSRLFSGKNLSIGGSSQLNPFDEEHGDSYLGDVSAVITKNLPLWVQVIRTPNLEIALMDEWESKIEAMANYTIDQDVVSMSGVPTWTLVLLQRLLEMKGCDSILDVWPNLELFAHGAVSFTPYRSLFKELIPSDRMDYLETYNASEGFFGLQDQPNSDELLLMLDYGIYYEFIPMSEWGKENPETIGLDKVEKGKNYALVISTNAGLWRYLIGDTIRFTSINPYRIHISGRTKHFINAFGEEVIVENAETAITRACEATGATLDNFTAAPRYLGQGKKGGHEWVIEFQRMPDDLHRFRTLLDETLREVNSDYDAKRHRDIALEAPVVHAVTQGTFYEWMRKRGKLGGQNKVPRLSNTREYLDDLLEMIDSQGRRLEQV